MKIIFLAGGYDQITFIEHLQQAGHYVILVDYTLNPLAKSVADEFYQISTLDLDSVLNLVKVKNIDLITTACTDQALLTAAYVSEILNLPFYLSYEQARNVTDKVYMKQIFIKNGIPTAKSIMLNAIEELRKPNGLQFPVVVKPCDCNSSKGILKIENKHTLHEAVEQAFKLSRSHKIIIEEYVTGRELSVDIWLSDTKPILIGISQTNKGKRKNTFTIVQSEYPVSLTKETMSRILEAAKNIAKAFKLKNMPLLIQLVENEGDIKILEFSARMGGGTKYRLINYISAIDVVMLYTKLILSFTPPPVQARKTII